MREDLINVLKKHPNRTLGKLVKQQKGDKIIPSDFYRLVSLEEIDEDTGRIVHYKEVPELGSEKMLFNAGNIIISKLQPEKGKVAIINDYFAGCVGSSELVPFVLDSDEVSKDYLWAVLRSDYILKQWGYSLSGSSRMRIGSNELGATIIPITDKKIQTEIVNEISEKLGEGDKIMKEIEILKAEAKQSFLDLLIG